MSAILKITKSLSNGRLHFRKTAKLFGISQSTARLPEEAIFALGTSKLNSSSISGNCNQQVLTHRRHSLQSPNCRHLWGWLNTIFNLVSEHRINEVGPDRACVEWLMRCGAVVKFIKRERWQMDYNTLPTGDFRKDKIEMIDATDSAVMNIGFTHLKDCHHVRWIRLKNASYVDNEALAKLAYVKDSLEHLEVISCGNVTDKGLANLCNLTNLKYLKLYDLPYVKDRSGCLSRLQATLSSCTIEYPEASNPVTKTTNR